MEVTYTIGAVSRKTGLSVHVLRAWERRYKAVVPVRTDAGGRLYTDGDLSKLRLLKRLTEAGHGIGRIASLTLDELRQIAPPSEGSGAAAEGAEPTVEGEVAGILGQAQDALTAMDGEGLRAILTRAALRLSSREFSEGVVIPLLRRTGDLWVSERICPAHEHLLSAELSRVLGWLAGSIPVSAGSKSAIATTPAGQRHEFGAYLAGIVAAEEGWRVTYLGPDLPAEDIATAYRTKRASVVLLSVAFEDRFDEVRAEIEDLRKAIGLDGRILVGGVGVEGRSDELDAAGATLVDDLSALRRALREGDG